MRSVPVPKFSELIPEWERKFRSSHTTASIYTYNKSQMPEPLLPHHARTAEPIFMPVVPCESQRQGLCY